VISGWPPQTARPGDTWAESLKRPLAAETLRLLACSPKAIHCHRVAVASEDRSVSAEFGVALPRPPQITNHHLTTSALLHNVTMRHASLRASLSIDLLAASQSPLEALVPVSAVVYLISKSIRCLAHHKLVMWERHRFAG